MKHLSFILTISFIAVAFAAPAYAYLDPGTGSMVFQAVVAVFLGAAATGKLWWSRLKGLFCGKGQRDRHE